MMFFLAASRILVFERTSGGKCTFFSLLCKVIKSKTGVVRPKIAHVRHICAGFWMIQEPSTHFAEHEKNSKVNAAEKFGVDFFAAGMGAFVKNEANSI